MKIRWIILFFPLLSVIVLSLAVQQHAAKAQSAPNRRFRSANLASRNRAVFRSANNPRHHVGHQFRQAHVGTCRAL